MQKSCPKCGQLHNMSGTFCSRRCANSRVFSSETNQRKSDAANEFWSGKRKTKPCKICGTPILKMGDRVRCESCATAAKVKQPHVPFVKISPTERSIKLVESGEVLQQVEGQIRVHMKRYLVAKYGHVCAICGITEWCGLPVPLVCDHIDGDSSNSNVNNFRLVCNNCDAQLPTYKSKNRGRGRKYDRERYQDSKK